MVIGENIYKWPLSIANCQYTAHFPTDLCPFSLGKDALKTRWRWDPIGDPCRRSASSGDISRCSAALGTYHTSTSGLVVLTILKHLNKLIGTVFSQSIGDHNPQENPRTYTGWWYTYPSEKYESQLG